jgi:hypothetical protein
MLQCGNGGLSDAECRSHFGLWALAKAPLVIGAGTASVPPPPPLPFLLLLYHHFFLLCSLALAAADPRKWSPSQLAIMTNKGVIAVNQDALGVQVREA